MLQRAVGRALSFLLCTRTVQQRTIENRAAAGHEQPPRQLLEDVLESSSKCWRREVEYERIEARVKRAGEQRMHSPARAVVAYISNHVWDVVGHEADNKDQKCAQCHPDGSIPLLGVDAGQIGEDVDEFDVAEAADEERHEKEHREKLQANRKEDLELFGAEFIITGVTFGWIGEVGVQMIVVLHDVDDTAVRHGDHPEYNAGYHCISRFAFELVFNGESYTQVALHADGRQVEGAVVDGGVEDESRQRAEEVRQRPFHVGCLHHAKRQEKEKDQVRDG